MKSTWCLPLVFYERYEKLLCKCGIQLISLLKLSSFCICMRLLSFHKCMYIFSTVQKIFLQTNFPYFKNKSLCIKFHILLYSISLNSKVSPPKPPTIRFNLKLTQTHRYTTHHKPNDSNEWNQFAIFDTTSRCDATQKK